MHREVTALFQHRSPDLLEEFRVFLPDQGGLLGLAEVGGPGKDKKSKGLGAEGQRKKRKAPNRDARGETKGYPSVKVVFHEHG